MSDLRDDERRAIEAMQRAAAAADDGAYGTSPFATARAARALDAAIDADTRSRARWTTTRVAAVALVAAASAGVLAFQLARAPDGDADVAVVAPAAAEARTVVAVTAATAATAAPMPSAGTPAFDVRAVEEHEHELDAPALDAHELGAPEVGTVGTVAVEAVEAVEPAKRVRRGPVGESKRLVAAGDAVGAARVLVRAHDAAGAGAALALLARRHPEAISAVDDELAAVRTTDAMRLRCQHRLLHERDRRAMEACRAFGREHPQDAAARLLSFAAGRLAEDVGDLAWAEEEYSRALLLSPFAGLSGTDALLARARVRHAAGDDDEARADLRLYLHSEPAARGEPDVANLATALGL